jgi:hypothetical protein
MTKRLFLPASLLALTALLLTFGIALAHTTVQAGNYELEVGWLDEPPVVGQRNAVVINISDKTDASRPVDVSKLVVDLTYGGQTRPLALQPLSEDAANQYVSPLLPTIPGQYTVELRGQVGDGTQINVDVQPEEVMPADTLAFPAAAQAQAGVPPGTWLSGTALLVALLALILALIALQKARRA